MIPDAPVTGRQIHATILHKTKQGSQAELVMSRNRKDAELPDVLAHLLRPGPHDPALCKTVFKLVFFFSSWLQTNTFLSAKVIDKRNSHA